VIIYYAERGADHVATGSNELCGNVHGRMK
jgi:hypothetical protein